MATCRRPALVSAAASPSIVAGVLAWASAAGRVVAGDEIRYWAAPVAAAVFIFSQMLFRHARFARERLLCPTNWVLATFFTQLIVLPHVIEWFGPKPGVLPRLPHPEYINRAVLLSALAFIAFSAGLHLARTLGSAVHPTGGSVTPSRGLAFALCSLGGLGIVLAFGSPAGFLSAIASPNLMMDVKGAHSGTLRGASATFLKPTLAIGIVTLWSRWYDSMGSRASAIRRRLVAAVACSGVIVAGLSLGFNRAAVVVPLAAFAAAYYWGRPRTRCAVLAIAAAAALVPAILAGVYRSAVDDRTFDDVLSELDLGTYFQVYAMAPQFPAYFMESVDVYGTVLGPSTLLNSALSPVPVLGKGVRERSGTAVYNRLIYGAIDAADQISPFLVEVTLSTGLAGLVLAYALLGAVVNRLQRTFVGASSSFAAWVAQYAAIWCAFLIVGSLSAFSQVMLYSFWPLILIAFARSLAHTLFPRRRGIVVTEDPRNGGARVGDL